MKDLYRTLANCHPSLKRGEVRCKKCGHTQKIDSSKCFQYGWPECCGETMTIDKPKKQNEEKP